VTLHCKNKPYSKYITCSKFFFFFFFRSQIDNKVHVTDDCTHVKSAQVKVGQLAGAEDGNNNAVAVAAAQDDEEANQSTVDKTLTCGQ
jgi:hypothetical protein